MAQYFRVSPNFWKGRRDWSDREKLLAQYLLSCPHRNLEGLFWLPLAYVEADLGWQAKIVRGCMATIERDEFAAYDEDAQVLFLCKALSFQAPSTEKQVIGAMSSLERVPKTVLWDLFVEACERWAPKLFQAIRISSDPDAQSHSNAIPIRFEPDPDIAGTLNSSSNSYSNSRPPNPPTGGRRRDRQKWREEFTAWIADHPPELLIDEWEPVRLRLAGAADVGYDAYQLASLHPHSLVDDVWLLGGTEMAKARLKELGTRGGFKVTIGFDWELIDCQCELTREQAV